MKVTVIGEELNEKEVQAYIDRAIDKYNGHVEELTIEVDGEFVNLTYKLDTNKPFQRIRRITGYLVGTTDRWNSAKRAEESDRVKHA